MNKLIFIGLSTLSFFVKSQIGNSDDHVKVSFGFPNKIVKDSNELIVNIIFNNSSSNPVWVYSTLGHGNPGDDDNNIYIVVEKFNGQKYQNYALSYDHKFNTPRTDTSCHDLAKSELAPFSSRVLSYDLMKIGKFFYRGSIDVRFI